MKIEILIFSNNFISKQFLLTELTDHTAQTCDKTSKPKYPKTKGSVGLFAVFCSGPCNYLMSSLSIEQ